MKDRGRLYTVVDDRLVAATDEEQAKYHAWLASLTPDEREAKINAMPKMTWLAEREKV